jgi:hypothetical protein
MANAACPGWELSLPLARPLPLQKGLLALAHFIPAGLIPPAGHGSLQTGVPGVATLDAGGQHHRGAVQGVISLPPETPRSTQKTGTPPWTRAETMYFSNVFMFIL